MLCQKQCLSHQCKILIRPWLLSPFPTALPRRKLYFVLKGHMKQGISCIPNTQQPSRYQPCHLSQPWGCLCCFYSNPILQFRGLSCRLYELNSQLMHLPYCRAVIHFKCLLFSEDCVQHSMFASSCECMKVPLDSSSPKKLHIPPAEQQQISGFGGPVQSRTW